MPTYTCAKCAHIFKRKSGYDAHMAKKTDCSTTTALPLLIAAQATAPATALATALATVPTAASSDLSGKSKPELIALCKERKLAGYSTRNKADLIALLTSSTDNVIVYEGPSGEALPSSPALALALPALPALPVLPAGTESAATGSIELNTFTVGDNVGLLKRLPADSVDMIYMDPPYNTGRNFYYFEDKFADFPKFIEERLVECHRVLKKDGNIIIHVEPRISHHIRVLCDKYFGESHFQNEIAWHSGGNAKNKYQLGRNHDTLIVYGKSAKPKFFPLYKPYSDDHKAKQKMCAHHKKLYSTSAAHNSQPEVNPRPNLTYEWNGNLRQWYFSKDKMAELHADNRLEYNDKGIPRIKRFMEEMEGIPVRDTWDDISSIQSGEKTKYATQKPIKLLERVLSLYSAEGDTCLDPFAGSGTVGRAAAAMKRNYILFDINPEAKALFEEKEKPTVSHA